MARVIGKTEEGEEVRAYDFDVKDYECKSVGDREIVIIGTTEMMDRDGESVSIDGWDLKNFKRNPVILPQHDYRQPAIGKALNVKKDNGKLMFKIQFPDEGIHPLADVYHGLYKTGFMNASSVGFIPREWFDGDGKKKPYRTFTKQELLELSLVSVPANPEAIVTEKCIVKAKESGVISEEQIQLLHEFVGSIDIKEDQQRIIKIPETKEKPGDIGTEEHERFLKVVNDVVEKNFELYLPQIEAIVRSVLHKEVKSNAHYFNSLLDGDENGLESTIDVEKTTKRVIDGIF